MLVFAYACACAGGDFLVNGSQLAFGVRQNGQPVNNVQLPPWANGPDDMLAKHRCALHGGTNLLVCAACIPLVAVISDSIVSAVVARTPGAAVPAAAMVWVSCCLTQWFKSLTPGQTSVSGILTYLCVLDTLCCPAGLLLRRRMSLRTFTSGLTSSLATSRLGQQQWRQTMCSTTSPTRAQ